MRLRRELGGRSRARGGFDLSRRRHAVGACAGPIGARCFRRCATALKLRPTPKITVECAPGTLTEPVLDGLVRCGVNRVSLGVQSFVDEECSSVGRLHTRAITLDDIARLRALRHREHRDRPHRRTAAPDAGQLGFHARRKRWRPGFLTSACTCWKWMKTRVWAANCWPEGSAITRTMFPTKI